MDNFWLVFYCPGVLSLYSVIFLYGLSFSVVFSFLFERNLTLTFCTYNVVLLFHASICVWDVRSAWVAPCLPVACSLDSSSHELHNQICFRCNFTVELSALNHSVFPFSPSKQQDFSLIWECNTFSHLEKQGFYLWDWAWGSEKPAFWSTLALQTGQDPHCRRGVRVCVCECVRVRVWEGTQC